MPHQPQEERPGAVAFAPLLQHPQRLSLEGLRIELGDHEHDRNVALEQPRQGRHRAPAAGVFAIVGRRRRRPAPGDVIDPREQDRALHTGVAALELGLGDEVGDVHGPGRSPRHEDPLRIAAELRGVLTGPGHRRGEILRARWELEFRGKAIGDVDADETVARGPEGDVVQIGRARIRALVAHHEAAAVNEDEDRPLAGGAVRGEHIQSAPLVGAVLRVPGHLHARIGLCLVLALVDCLRRHHGGQDLAPDGADLLGGFDGGSGHRHS